AKDHLGDFDGARAAWNRTAHAALGLPLPDSSMAGVTVSALGRQALRLGDITRAESNLNRAAAILSRSGDSYQHAINDGFRAELAVQTGRIRDALALYETLLAYTRRMGDKL